MVTVIRPTTAFVRIVAIPLIAVGCVLSLVMTSTSSPVSRLLANALIMGGTFTPTPDQAFVDIAIKDFTEPTVDPKLLPVEGITVTYPASGGIISGPGAPTINESVAIGVANLEAALAAQPAGQPVVVFGFSQSTVVSMMVKSRLSALKAQGETVPDVTFVGIGVGNRPHGGITTRLQGITIPIFDFTFNGPAPTDPEFGFSTIDISREYDGLSDFPLYVGNVPAVVNAALGVLFVHALYNEVSLDPNSPEYVPGTVVQQYGDTTYYQIPTPDLPLFDPLRILGVPEALIDVVEPAVKVVVDAGYDRTIPFGEPTPLRLVPQIDPVDFTADLAAAAGTGFGNALKLLTPTTEGAARERDDDEPAGMHPHAVEESDVGDDTTNRDDTAKRDDATNRGADAPKRDDDAEGLDGDEADEAEKAETATPRKSASEPANPASTSPDGASPDSESSQSSRSEQSAAT